MSSVLKVDRIQSDTGTVNVASKIEFPVGSAAAPSIFPTGDTNTGIFFPAADRVGVSTGGTQRIEVDASGNVGINDTNPAGVLGSTAGGLIIRDGGRAGSTTQVAFLNSSGLITFGMTAGGSFTQNSLPAFASRAWVNFNGTGTPAIRGAGNVSSITDNGTGNYIVNFANAMPDNDFAVSGCTGGDSSDPNMTTGAFICPDQNTGNFKIRTGSSSSDTDTDREFIFGTVHR